MSGTWKLRKLWRGSGRKEGAQHAILWNWKRVKEGSSHMVLAVVRMAMGRAGFGLQLYSPGCCCIVTRH